MKIVILGAGQVGSSIAENLSDRNNDVTLVDINADILASLQDRLDIKTIVGRASHPDILEQANIANADMILAVTNSDETNIVACQVAYTLYKTPQKIARVRNFSYASRPELFANDNMPIDYLISPENVVADYIFKLIELPGTQQVMDFANSLVKIVAVRAHTGGLMVGHKIQEIREHIPEIDTRIVGIFRHGYPIIPDPEEVIREDDLVYFIALTKDIPAVMREMRRKDKLYKRIMIAGGGNIGMLLAKKLEKSYSVKLIEKNNERAKLLSEALNETIVLVGDVSDKDLLIEENIESTDAFIAVTSADEANILSSMSAKRLGAYKVLTLVNRPSYISLLDKDIIDVAISPKQATISTLLARVRSKNVVSAYALCNITSEIIEIVVTEAANKAINLKINEIKLPASVAIVAIVRGEKIVIAHNDIAIEANDRLIISLLDRDKAQEVEKIFSPN